MAAINSSSHILTQGGYIKEPLKIVNAEGEKIRLYRLQNTEKNTLDTAKQAIKNAQNEKERDYDGKIGKFYEDVQTRPYLLREGNTLKLLSKDEADAVLEKYGISGKKAEELSTGALDLLKENNIQTGQDLIKLYNTSDEETRKTLFPLFNIMLVIFQNKRPIQREEEIKTLTLFATCDDDRIRTAALDAMMQLFEADGFQNVDYGYGLKYLIDNLPPEFLNTNQLRLLTIFEKLTIHLDNLLHTGRTVNHEIEPLMAALISIARATRQSEIPGLAKGTKDNFYARLKQFYQTEEYTKRITSLSKDKNYLLEFEAIWPLQHLVRVPSSEHKAVTFIRKAGHGLYATKQLAEAAADAMGVVNAANIVSDLEKAWEHGEKAFGFKDIPRPWLEMLERTEEALMKSELTPQTLEIVYKDSTDYDEVRQTFNKVVIHKLKKSIGKDKNEVSLQENKEFAFGFVGQLSDLSMDHPDQTIRHQSIDILERIFMQEGQSKDVRVFILTSLQNIIQSKGNPEDIQKAKTLKDQLESHKPKLKGAQLFRASKYPCLALKPDSTLLLDAAKQKLERVSRGKEALPLSEFIFNPKIITTHEELFIEGNLNITQMSVDDAIKLAKEGRVQHHMLLEANQGKIQMRTQIAPEKKVTVTGKTTVKGDFNL